MTINEFREKLAHLDGERKIYVSDADTGGYLPVDAVQIVDLKDGRRIAAISSEGYSSDDTIDVFEMAAKAG